MAKSKKNFPHEMTFKELVIYIISVILTGLFFFFIRGDLAGKMIAFMVCPMMIGYLIYAYHKEKKADKNALVKNEKLIDGSYFESKQWHNDYVRYMNEHSFERPKYSDMKKDLLKRFQRREYIRNMLFLAFLLFCTGCAALMGNYFVTVFGVIFFGLLFLGEFLLFIGMPVRKWCRGDIDYNALDNSYKNSWMLTYKKNGLAFGTTHIHGFTEKKIYAIDYRLVEGISRKIVRLKTYEDGIYSKEEYRHFAVIHVKLPYSGEINHVEIELNEFQVQMAIDRLSTYKYGEGLQRDILIKEEKENVNVM